MQYKILTDNNLKTSAEISIFHAENGISEYHTMIKVTEKEILFSEQINNISVFFNNICKNELSGAKIIFQRFFLSDAANQTNILKKYLPENNNNISIIEQPPLNGSKIALWAYLQTDVCTSATSGLFKVTHGKYCHFWRSLNSCNKGNSEEQMRGLFEEYIAELEKQNCSLAKNCIRTWIFVQNVDLNYSGVVKARCDIFAKHGLTEKSHYIASTGICGRQADAESLVLMDTYAVSGLKPEQIKYLYARKNLSPTYKYGVTFERGTCILYGDRRHVFISGTASINNEGQIVHEGDVCKQTERTIENVGALLNEADCGFEDIAQIIVYLRDIADYENVRKITEKYFQTTPKIIVLAPVCRPGWLVEMECFAIKKDNDNIFEPL